MCARKEQIMEFKLFTIVSAASLCTFCFSMEVEQAASAAQANPPVEIIQPIASAIDTALENPRIKDVLGKFDALPTKATAVLRALDSKMIPQQYYAKKAKVIWEIILAALKIKKRYEGLSHFQSIIRIPRTNIILLSGGNAKNKVAHLFIIQMASEPAHDPWHSTPSNPEPGDEVVRKINLFEGQAHWHASGMGLCGKYLVIPLEGDAGSMATFYDMSNPLEPVKLETSFNIHGGCMGMTLTRLLNNHYLLGAMMNTNCIALYYSKTTHLEDGFIETPIVPDLHRDHSRSNYQNISFMMQDDGIPFLAATQNAKKTAPIINGDDYADLFQIALDMQRLDEYSQLLMQGKTVDKLAPAALAFRIRQKKFICDKNGNFNAGATLCSHSPERISLEATPHWPEQEMVRFITFEH